MSFVFLHNITSYFCARLDAKAEGHPSHTMARSPAAQMTWKLLPGPMGRACPVQGGVNKKVTPRKSTDFAFFIASCIAVISKERDCMTQV
jgi:hypothetical protein